MRLRTRPADSEGSGRALLEVGHEDAQLVAVFAKVGYRGDRGLDGLADSALLVKLDEAAPLAELIARLDLDDRHFASAQRLDQTHVLGVIAVGGQAAQASGAIVEDLGGLVKATAEAVGRSTLAQNAAKCLQVIDLLLLANLSGGGGRCRRGLLYDLGCCYCAADHKTAITKIQAHTSLWDEFR